MTDTLLVNIAAFQRLKSPNPLEYNGCYLFIKLYDFFSIAAFIFKYFHPCSFPRFPFVLFVWDSTCVLTLGVHVRARTHTHSAVDSLHK